MDYRKVIAVTNRHIAGKYFMSQVEKAVELGVKAVILREKDLSISDYEELARQVMEICDYAGVPCVLHTFTDVAIRLGCPYIHLSLQGLNELVQHQPEKRKNFQQIGVSIHSVSQAQQAQNMHATYVTAGHIFETDCKKGLEPRGLEFLKNVCDKVSIPVFGIGGVTEENWENVCSAGAAGVCIMSGFMKK